MVAKFVGLALKQLVLFWIYNSMSNPVCCKCITLQWSHNECDGISNRQPYDCLLRCLVRRRSKKTSKLRITGLCEGNSPVTGEFPAQRASNSEKVSIWWCHHDPCMKLVQYNKSLVSTVDTDGLVLHYQAISCNSAVMHPCIFSCLRVNHVLGNGFIIVSIIFELRIRKCLDVYTIP